MRGLTICWCRIKEQEQRPKDLARVQESIVGTVRLLTNVLKRDVDVLEEYQVLIDSDARLRDLLVTDSRTQEGFDRSNPYVK